MGPYGDCMEECECPYCDYTGPVDSVEGHISARTDGGHAGELGRYHREELVGRAAGDEQGAESSESVAESVDSAGPGTGIVVATLLFALVIVAISVMGDGGESDQSLEEESDEDEQDGQVALVEG